ncbi:MAG: hypothetical protein C0582_00610 [Alphaproteobacteria bacterium]|nr:MAG: hypothetical protein C0582_00610 [Alphaproteobacteria bacterium]
MENRVRVNFFIIFVFSFAIFEVSSRSIAGVKTLESLGKPKDGSSSDDKSKKDDHKLNGGYLGLGMTASHLNAKVNSNDLGGSGAYASLIMGGGKKVRKAYLSGELDVNYGSILATKKSYGKLASNLDLGASFRVGYADKNKIIPYLKVGFGWTRYKLKVDGEKKSFSATYFAPGAGVEIPILSASFLRLEAAYAMNMAGNSLKGYTFDKKPNRILFKLAGLTRF